LEYNNSTIFNEEVIQMMNYKKMNFNDIVEWCKANNQVEWLKQTVGKTVVYEKDGMEMARTITFIEIKKEFAAKFMPEILPVAKEKKPSMFDIIAGL
jgi:hypothetical protein